MFKKSLIAATVVTVLGVGTLGAGRVFAQTTNTSSNPTSSLVQKIAERFGLQQADVQAVFDQERQDRQAEMETKYETQLSQYVTDGKITEAQKQLILAKHKELQAQREARKDDFQTMTQDERRAAKETERQELQTWAKENSIDLRYLMFGHGMRGHRERAPNTP